MTVYIKMIVDFKNFLFAFPWRPHSPGHKQITKVCESIFFNVFGDDRVRISARVRESTLAKTPANESTRVQLDSRKLSDVSHKLNTGGNLCTGSSWSLTKPKKRTFKTQVCSTVCLCFVYFCNTEYCDFTWYVIVCFTDEKNWLNSFNYIVES